jgi:hypothetical protein
MSYQCPAGTLSQKKSLCSLYFWYHSPDMHPPRTLSREAGLAQAGVGMVNKGSDYLVSSEFQNWEEGWAGSQPHHQAP